MTVVAENLLVATRQQATMAKRVVVIRKSPHPLTILLPGARRRSVMPAPRTSHVAPVLGVTHPTTGFVTAPSTQSPPNDVNAMKIFWLSARRTALPHAVVKSTSPLG